MTAGPWTPGFARLRNVSLNVTRQPVAWFEVREPGRWSPERAPCWAVERDEHSFYYGFPLVAGGSAMKVSVHEVREAVDPDSVDREVHPHEVEEFKTFLDQTFPKVFGSVRRTSVCLYTNSPDGHFLIDRHPDHTNVLVASGFSGHGFKFAPVIGEVLADWCVDGVTTLPVAFLNASRFADSS